MVSLDRGCGLRRRFHAIKRKYEAQDGRYRRKGVILAIYDTMTEAIRTGRPYQSLLDPPPGPPPPAC